MYKIYHIFTNCKNINGHFNKYFFEKKKHKFNNISKFRTKSLILIDTSCQYLV